MSEYNFLWHQQHIYPHWLCRVGTVQCGILLVRGLNLHPYPDNQTCDAGTLLKCLTRIFWAFSHMPPTQNIGGAFMDEGASGKIVFCLLYCWQLLLLSVYIQDGFRCSVLSERFFVLHILYLRHHHFLSMKSFVLLITPRLGCNMAARRPFWLQSELQSHRAPGGCSVVSVDPVGLAAATSGYWVSAGGHDNQNTWWWHKGRLCESIIIFSSFLKFSNVLFFTNLEFFSNKISVLFLTV